MAKDSVYRELTKQTLNPYERSILACRPFGDASEAARDGSFQDAFKAIQGVSCNEGDYKGLTYGQVLAVRMFGALLEKPDPSKVKDAFVVSGQLRQGAEVDLRLSAVDESLAKRALGASDGE